MVILKEARVMDEKEKEDTVKSAIHVPRSFTIKKEVLVKNGYTASCAGCKAILRGATRQAHSDYCRRRLAKDMRGDEKVREARKRENEFLEKALAESEEKNAKKSNI